LRQILLNLLGNAIKFTDQGEVILRVKSEAVDSRNQQLEGEQDEDNGEAIKILFEVEDTGPGIAPDDLKRLFKPFEQTRSGMIASEGTGLGLAISRKYVHMLGGDITVHSQLGRGTVFSFTISVIPVDGVSVESQAAIAGKVVKLAPQQPIYRILVAEDNPANRLVLMTLLTKVGFDLEEAVNGQEAIELWQTWHPHLIFMDVRMPFMNGYEATRQIRAQEPFNETQRTKIIALTASAFEEQREEALASGCDDFIRKPFKAQEIFEKIAHHLSVEYLYEETTDTASTSESQVRHSYTLDPALLQTMSSEWIEQLYQAAIQGNDLQILTLTKDIPAHQHTLAETLSYFAENFQFDKITEAVSLLELSR